MTSPAMTAMLKVFINSYLQTRLSCANEPRCGVSHALEQMAHFCFFGLHVGAGNLGDARLAGNSLDDAYTSALKLPHFFGGVGKQANFRGAELLQDFRCKIVVARGRGTSQ